MNILKDQKLNLLSVAAFTGGSSVPSARFRVRQYINHLEREGIKLNEFSAHFGMYPPSSKLLRPFWGLATLASRIPGIISSHDYDITLLQREMLSTYFTLERFTKNPRILDVDDSIWLHRGGNWTKRLANVCEGIICGNNFTAENFSKWNSNITVIPTAIDTKRYYPNNLPKEPIIGWSGTSGGFGYLYMIESALQEVLKRVPNSMLRIVSDRKPYLKNIPDDRIEFILWSPKNEVRAIQEMAIGIMPLKDSLWENGKCSFKMLTYMACGIPVVVSPFGMNKEVLKLGDIGIGANNIQEWSHALISILNDSQQQNEMGENGRKVILKYFSIDVITPLLAKTLHNLM